MIDTIVSNGEGKPVYSLSGILENLRLAYGEIGEKKEEKVSSCLDSLSSIYETEWSAEGLENFKIGRN